MKQTTVASLQFAKTWTNKSGGTMFQFEIEFHDGEFGECNSTSEQPPYKVGDTVWYEMKGTSPQGTKRFKVSKNAPQQGGGFNYTSSKGDAVGCQWAINAARETLIGRGEDITIEALEMWAKELVKLRDILVSQTS